ncbi:MAG: glycosyltransferase [Planctomycetes bacterium]|nr:glycosyltransferase [Planctomycetota bacterium]
MSGPTAADRVPQFDVRGMAFVFAAVGVLYGVSVCPVVFWGDSGEFALRAASLELSPIARGYPLHRLLSWLAGHALGSPALGANAISALFGALAAALTHEGGRRLSGSRVGGFAAAATLAMSPTFWLFSGVAEVYTMHAAILAASFLCALEAPRSRGFRFALGAMLGLSFLHHRMTAFAAPGIAVLAFAGRREPEDLRGLRGLLVDLLVGFGIGIVPFAVLCATASRPAPPDAGNAFAWWFSDIFLGGGKNAEHLFGSGKRTFGGNLAYVGRWVVYNLPGPALGLAGWGILRLRRLRPVAFWAFLVFLPLHLAFPFRYDWTGDQFSFLVPVYVLAALLVAVGVAGVEARWGSRCAKWAAAATGLAPACVAVVLAFTSVGERAFPAITRAARIGLVLPLRAGDTSPRDVCRRNLDRLPVGAVLHTDWGDGQVYLYLQRVDHLREDVEIRIWRPVPRALQGAEVTGHGPVVAIVPAFNEQDAVAHVVRDLLALPEPPVVLVVDDGSSDATGARAREAGAIVLRPGFNLGIGGAVQTGFLWAARHGARAVIQVDGDGQHPASEVSKVLAPVLAGHADVAIGSRFLGTTGDRSTGARRAGMGWLSILIRLRCGRQFTDPTSGLRAFGPAPVAWLAEAYPEDYPEPQVLAPLVRHGFRVEEVPVSMQSRRGGRSSISGLRPLLYMVKVSVSLLLGSMK